MEEYSYFNEPLSAIISVYQLFVNIYGAQAKIAIWQYLQLKTLSIKSVTWEKAPLYWLLKIIRENQIKLL